MINGTPMQRLRDRQRVSVAPERIAALQARSVEAAVETVAEVAVEVAAQSETLETVQSDLVAARTDLDTLLEL